ncbi:MAG: ATP-binding protein [Proteobacteria bacterium]|nr:ATP-binding protein [Pseudomonadota bacterium]
MKKKSKGEVIFLDVPPDPERISESLRDTGYEFNTAVADIIDNSISAKATVIDVRMAMDFGGQVFVSVADNGIGMDREELVNAMRYGSRRRADPASLGKFGLGLKTASTAFCRRLSVTSRNSADSLLLRATWDLDHIKKTDKWELSLANATGEDERLLAAVGPKSSGTVVLWEKVDRLLRDYVNPEGKYAQNALKRYEDELRFHISMVYQRFLDSADSRARHVTIRVNGTPVAAWDPFRVVVTKRPIAEITREVEIGSKTAAFTVRAFVLPRKDEYPSEEERKAAHLANDMQGIYVYRENRLIHGPDWLEMFRKEPHYTLCRVELSFDHGLDDAFQVDIKKSRILLNETLYEWLRDNFLAGPRREAQARARKGASEAIAGAAALLHAASNSAIHAKAGDVNTAQVTSVDGRSGSVTVNNKLGTTTLRIRLVDKKNPGEFHVQPTESLQDGMLWEPAFIDGNSAVLLNTGHPYYQKVYIPNRKSGVTVQGLDSLMWALCVAEINNVSEANKRNFEEMRYEVSRVLRKLVDDLPDPLEDEDEDMSQASVS